jgi:hypothetical protein
MKISKNFFNFISTRLNGTFMRLQYAVPGNVTKQSSSFTVFRFELDVLATLAISPEVAPASGLCSDLTSSGLHISVRLNWSFIIAECVVKTTLGRSGVIMSDRDCCYLQQLSSNNDTTTSMGV